LIGILFLDSEERVKALTVADLWVEYLVDRKLHWGERHYQDI